MVSQPHIQLIYEALSNYFNKYKTPIGYEEFEAVLDANTSSFYDFVLGASRILGDINDQNSNKLKNDLKLYYVDLLKPIIVHMNEKYNCNYQVEKFATSFANALRYTGDIVNAYRTSKSRINKSEQNEPKTEVVERNSDPSSYEIKYNVDRNCSWIIQRGDRKGDTCGGNAVAVIYNDETYQLNYCKSCIVKKAKVSNIITNKFSEFDVSVIINKLRNTRRVRKPTVTKDKKSKNVVDKRDTGIFLTPLAEKGFHFLEELGFIAKTNPETYGLEIIGKLDNKGMISEIKVIPLDEADEEKAKQHGYLMSKTITEEDLAKATSSIIDKQTATYIMKQSDVKQNEEAFLRYHTTMILSS